MVIPESDESVIPALIVVAASVLACVVVVVTGPPFR